MRLNQEIQAIPSWHCTRLQLGANTGNGIWRHSARLKFTRPNSLRMTNTPLTKSDHVIPTTLSCTKLEDRSIAARRNSSRGLLCSNHPSEISPCGVCGNTGSHHDLGLRRRVPPLLTCGNTLMHPTTYAVTGAKALTRVSRMGRVAADAVPAPSSVTRAAVRAARRSRHHPALPVGRRWVTGSVSRLFAAPVRLDPDLTTAAPPSVEAVVRLADIFDVSCGDLFGDDLGDEIRRPLRAGNPLADRLTDLDNLTDTDRQALIHILDSLLANTRIRAALNTAS